MRVASCAQDYETMIVFAEDGPPSLDGYTTQLMYKSVFDMPPFGVRSCHNGVSNLIARSWLSAPCQQRSSRETPRPRMSMRLREPRVVVLETATYSVGGAGCGLPA